MKKILHYVTDSLEEFRSFAKKAAGAGATHVIISDMPRSRWMWDMDRTDPYPNWSMGQCQLFKLVCPPELEPYLPLEHIRSCMELAKRRSGILKEYGLRAAICSNEPFWLPEQVYRDHPDWRGARCDHPRRARKPYFSPSIDNEEVLSMYRYAMKKIAEETGADFIQFKTNDCGGGVAWSSGTYTGPNGPSCVKEKSMTERICGFLDAVQEGGKDGLKEAGLTPDFTVYFESDIGLKAPETAIANSFYAIKDGQILNKKDRKGETVLATNLNFDLSKAPVRHLPRPAKLVRDIMRIAGSGAEVQLFEIAPTDLDESIVCFELAEKEGVHSLAGCARILEETAEKIAGESCAAALTDAWILLEEMYRNMDHTGVNLLVMGCEHQRWITRPLVLFPSELSEEDRALYRPFQFQALSEKEAEDLMNLQGIEIVRGFSAAFLIRQTVLSARNSLRQAVNAFRKAAELSGSEEIKQKIKMTVQRLLVTDCFYENITNTVDFQELVDRTDFEAEPVRSLRWPTRNDARAEEFQTITRAEIDNMYRLIRLLEGHLEEIILCTEPEKEDVFVFGNDFPRKLRRKAEIMLDHLNDAARVYETNNI